MHRVTVINDHGVFLFVIAKRMNLGHSRHIQNATCVVKDSGNHFRMYMSMQTPLCSP